MRSARKVTSSSKPSSSTAISKKTATRTNSRRRSTPIKDCAILYVAAIGGSGAARVVANNIHPMKVNQPEAIADLLDKLQDVLRGVPPPWLRKALTKGKERVLDFEE